MNKELLKRIIVENQRTVSSINLVRRQDNMVDDCNYVMVGIRQAGKSYMMFQRMQDLVSRGISPERMLYINFDDERLIGTVAQELGDILDAYRELFDCEPYIFMDEIQNITGWEHFARRLSNERHHVCITGSNARMLSRDIATTLGGRYICRPVFTFNFDEFLALQGITLSTTSLYGSEACAIARHMDSYLAFGGFAQLATLPNKREWLNNIFARIFFGDIISRNNVRNEAALRLTVRRMAESVMQPTTYTRLTNLIKSAGASVSRNTVMDYVRYLQDTCMTFTLSNIAGKFAERETTPKHYFSDNGLLSIFLSEGHAQLLENFVAIALHRRYLSQTGEPRVFYYRHNVEVDFYIPEVSTAIQACYSLSDAETERRETVALQKFAAAYDVHRLIIVTHDDDRVVRTSDGREIEVIAAWRWAIGMAGEQQ